MRLRRSRRAAGPTAAHNSQYGPRQAPTITAAQRDTVYQQILSDMRKARYLNGGDLSLLGKQVDLVTSRGLIRELSDDLQLILDALGLGETSSGADVALDLPAEQLRRTFSRLRERAVEQREESSREPVESQATYERSVVVIETCDQVLAGLRAGLGGLRP